jgi:hypothetical protein
MSTGTLTGTVTSTTPVMVLVDGAATSGPAEIIDGNPRTVGERVQVTCRDPQQPIIKPASDSTSVPTPNKAETRYGVDYSANTHADWNDFFEALLRSGRDFIMRYLLTSTGGKPDMSVAELTAAQYAGVDVGFWYERTAGTKSALSGHAQGHTDAADAVTGLTALGLTAAQPVYYSMDGVTNPSAGNLALIKAYLEAIGEDRGGITTIGVYASRTVIAYLQSLSPAVCTYYCQALWFHDGPLLSGVHMSQTTVPLYIAGITCDRDTSYYSDWGQIPA